MSQNTSTLSQNASTLSQNASTLSQNTSTLSQNTSTLSQNIPLHLKTLRFYAHTVLRQSRVFSLGRQALLV